MRQETTHLSIKTSDFCSTQVGVPPGREPQNPLQKFSRKSAIFKFGVPSSYFRNTQTAIEGLRTRHHFHLKSTWPRFWRTYHKCLRDLMDLHHDSQKSIVYSVTWSSPLSPMPCTCRDKYTMSPICFFRSPASSPFLEMDSYGRPVLPNNDCSLLLRWKRLSPGPFSHWSWKPQNLLLLPITESRPRLHSPSAPPGATGPKTSASLWNIIPFLTVCTEEEGYVLWNLLCGKGVHKPRNQKSYHPRPPMILGKNVGIRHLTTFLLQPNRTLLDKITNPRYEKSYHPKPPMTLGKNVGIQHLTTFLLQPNPTLLDKITNDLKKVRGLLNPITTSTTRGDSQCIP